MKRALELVAALLGGLPFGWLRWLGVPIGWLVGSVLRVRRVHVEAAVARAGIERPARVARAMYRSLAASVLEMLWMARRGSADLGAVWTMDEVSRRRLDEARAKGKGVVLAASHTGNWELAACAMARALDLLVVVKPISMGGVDAFMTQMRSRHGLGLAPPRGALEKARARLLRGGSVAMLVDQVPDEPEHAIPVDFLGAPAFADRAPASLAACAGAPLVVVAFRRTDAGVHAIEVLDVLDPPARDRRAWIEPATRRATRALDAFVRARPSEWLWLHRRWKTVRGPACKTLSSSPAEASRVASSSAPASTRTRPRPKPRSMPPAPRSSPSP